MRSVSEVIRVIPTTWAPYYKPQLYTDLGRCSLTYNDPPVGRTRALAPFSGPAAERRTAGRARNTERGSRNTEHGARSAKHGKRNTKNGARNLKHRQRNAEHGTRTTERGTWNAEQGTRKTDHGGLNTEQGTRNTPMANATLKYRSATDQLICI